MKAAVLHAYGAPVYDDFADPVPADGRVVVDVIAAGLNHADRLIASGTFYTGAPALPSVVGLDGVGALPDGRRVYFDACVSPFGSMAERTLIGADHGIDVPEGTSSAAAAALGNAGLAAWLSLTYTGKITQGDRVLVLGANGAVGLLAVQLARRFGAARVVAVGRDASRLGRAVELGADVAVATDDQDLEARLHAAVAGGADLIIDLVWGTPALAALGSAAPGVRLVQVGQLDAPAVAIPAALLRSKNATVVGHANFWAPADERAEAYRRMCELSRDGELVVDTETVPLREVGDAWARMGSGIGAKLVIAPGRAR